MHRRRAIVKASRSTLSDPSYSPAILDSVRLGAVRPAPAGRRCCPIAAPRGKTTRRKRSSRSASPAPAPTRVTILPDQLAHLSQAVPCIREPLETCGQSVERRIQPPHFGRTVDQIASLQHRAFRGEL